MARVAILGTEGTGKTVLMTVLAHRFKRAQAGFQLIPLTPETSKFVANNWECLRRCDWPASSREGVLTRLSWELSAEDYPTCRLQFHDVSGQDFRHLFSSTTAIPSHLKMLTEYVRSADVCAFLVNLSDFVRHPDAVSQSTTEAALCNAVQFVSNIVSPRRCAIVLTQIDLFQDLKKQFGTWEAVAKHYLPDFYRQFVETGMVSLLTVAAVGNVRSDPNAGPRARNIPATHWRSIGLENLLTWIGESVYEIDTQKRRKQLERERRTPPLVVRAPRRPPIEFHQKSGCATSLLSIALFLVLTACLMQTPFLALDHLIGWPQRSIDSHAVPQPRQVTEL